MSAAQANNTTKALSLVHGLLEMKHATVPDQRGVLIRHSHIPHFKETMQKQQCLTREGL